VFPKVLGMATQGLAYRRNQSHIARMQLGEWIETQPRGALRRLAERSGVAYRTLVDLKAGRRAAKPDTAEAVSIATGGVVSSQELVSPLLPYLQERANRRARRIQELQSRRDEGRKASA